MILLNAITTVMNIPTKFDSAINVAGYLKRVLWVSIASVFQFTNHNIESTIKIPDFDTEDTLDFAKERLYVLYTHSQKELLIAHIVMKPLTVTKTICNHTAL